MKPDFEKIRCAVFDFDGVILDSSGLKTECFRVLYGQYGGVCEEAMKYHLQHKGMSRLKQFDYVAKNLMEAADPGAVIHEMGERFAAIVFDRVSNAPFIAGAVELLDFLFTRASMYVISSSPENELSAIIKARGLGGYFRAFFGGVDSKDQYLERILSEEGLERGELLYVGDTMRDLEAARIAGVPFCGVQNPLTDFKSSGCQFVSGLAEIKALFERGAPYESAEVRLEPGNNG